MSVIVNLPLKEYEEVMATRPQKHRQDEGLCGIVFGGVPVDNQRPFVLAVPPDVFLPVLAQLLFILEHQPVEQRHANRPIHRFILVTRFPDLLNLLGDESLQNHPLAISLLDLTFDKLKHGLHGLGPPPPLLVADEGQHPGPLFIELL